MGNIGTALASNATRVLLLGAGELGKELAIELQRFGVEVIAVDRYPYAPAMQVAHRSHVISMLDGAALRRVIETEKPTYIVPELEAIDTQTLLELEQEGHKVIPSARATYITMNRERIRRLAAEQLALKTSAYHFAQTYDEYLTAVHDIGIPCVVKPIMSSSGKGQSIIRTVSDIDKAWQYAQTGGRTAQATKVIIEAFIQFDYEITLLTVIDRFDKVTFCDPIGHLQIDGDYRESWQPHPMSAALIKKSQEIAQKITQALGGVGIFGVELFIKGDDVYFSEVSPRPHDTGMVTLISQDLSEFALHARALLGLPIPSVTQFGPAASAALVVEGNSNNISFSNLDTALQASHTQLRLFGKPEVKGQRRLGVTLALGNSIEQARAKAMHILKEIQVLL